MAKVRCARCGEIFGLQQSEIQVCPRCGCRMKVNRPVQTAPRREQPPQQPAPQPAPPAASDEYDALRKEYMDMMRTKLAAGKTDKGDGVYLSKDEYNALVARQPAQQAAPVLPAEDTAVKAEEQPASAPAPAAAAYEPYGAPAPADDATAPAYYSDGTDESYEDEPARAPAANRKGLVSGWLAFIFALAAGALSALLLIFDVRRDLPEFTGMDMLVPDGGWMDFNFPFNPIIAVVFFLPALLAVFTLISAIRRGKGGKFVLAILYLIAGAALAILPVVYEWSLGNFDNFSFDLILDCFRTDNGVMTLVAAGVCAAAFLMTLIAGILTRSRRSMREAADSGEEDEAA